MIIGDDQNDVRRRSGASAGGDEPQPLKDNKTSKNATNRIGPIVARNKFFALPKIPFQVLWVLHLFPAECEPLEPRSGGRNLA